MANALAEKTGTELLPPTSRKGTTEEDGPALEVEISPGELLDKISILQIKSERIDDPAKLRNIQTELQTLTDTRNQFVETSPSLDQLFADLKRVNEALWDVEDELRFCEQRQDFGPEFVELARSVYRHNDRRSVLKRENQQAARLPARGREILRLARRNNGSASRTIDGAGQGGPPANAHHRPRASQEMSLWADALSHPGSLHRPITRHLRRVLPGRNGPARASDWPRPGRARHRCQHRHPYRVLRPKGRPDRNGFGLRTPKSPVPDPMRQRGPWVP
jgi:hypothetical protein